MKGLDSMSCERRRFLKVLGISIAGVGLSACGGSEGQAPASGPVAGGSVTDLALDSVRIAPGNSKVVVARDDKGIYAMSAICTHASCDMSKDGKISNSGLICDCHGSEFDRFGNVVTGPANSPLQHYKVTINNDQTITVMAGEIVSSTERVAIPV
jgi:Rieske Fe-S protein